ncbi:mitochondrial glycoprotein family member [Tieghemostelium lacteum]|uniref:Mitochondrial glycoprotein family member n=1 Tax=Tieghemostelium lacteum TaxID=361077 RepID=A0A151ZIG4_TIELA|nr:mitochondrial glycoprotein family member [Tieghemostelium lacteum]|eukprot:KYQ93689.1 mitochondrial glycoprotein family member [Tieghemostelium lacteum]
MSGKFIGNFVQTFQQGKTIFNTSKGLKKGLLTCCGSNFTAVPKSHGHHHHSALMNTNCSKSGIKTHLFQPTSLSNFSIRQYSNKIQSTPTPKSLLNSLCENEINDFKELIPEEDNVKAFLEESGFVLRRSKEGSSDVIFLTKTFADGTEITVKFDSMENHDQLPEDFDDYNQEGENENQEGEEEQHEEREEEEEEQQEEGEEGENQEGENQDDTTPHEHPFEIQIKSTKGNENTLTFGGFASQDGNYTISGFYKGGFNDTINPVDIAGTSAEFQDNILLLLQQYGINEKLSFFVHDYIHTKKLDDYISSFEALKDFVARK